MPPCSVRHSEYFFRVLLNNSVQFPSLSLTCKAKSLPTEFTGFRVLTRCLWGYFSGHRAPENTKLFGKGEVRHKECSRSVVRKMHNMGRLNHKHPGANGSPSSWLPFSASSLVHCHYTMLGHSPDSWESLGSSPHPGI